MTKERYKHLLNEARLCYCAMLGIGGYLAGEAIYLSLHDQSPLIDGILAALLMYTSIGKEVRYSKWSKELEESEDKHPKISVRKLSKEEEERRRYRASSGGSIAPW